MSPLGINHFEEYFYELHKRTPYDWQTRLAEQAVLGNWPGAIDLPTGSGKTACLDIAVFAMACQACWDPCERSAPRRIFFCVNRRIIVDEAFQRALHIAKRIAEAEAEPAAFPVSSQIAQALRQLSGIVRDSVPPLDALELRGGIYRDNRWARSATQPTIVCTTIDQLGSRLLFRGYGVSANAAPIHAALIAYDSLVLLDEAHISKPFLESLEFVRSYLNPAQWGDVDHPIGVSRMVVAPMTATPPEGMGLSNVIRLESKDRQNPGLNDRLAASKPAELTTTPNVVNSAVSQADSWMRSGEKKAVGVIVNRVATAKAIYEDLQAKHPQWQVELVIGSMRPIDRDQQSERLGPLIGPERPDSSSESSCVVATQCLEVGADYDFDALVTECASLDALRQRFGRLNRRGRKIAAQATILIDNKQVKREDQLDDAKPLDAVYGNALPRTWNWLLAQATIVPPDPAADENNANRRQRNQKSEAERRTVDFGIDGFDQLLSKSVDKTVPANLLAPSALLNAPVMLPAYVDMWCQTNPQPAPDPDVALFIHGPQSGQPDVQVCWRADLVKAERIKPTNWIDDVALLPPTAAECMSVPISRARKWLTGTAKANEQGDLLGAADADDTPSARPDKQPFDQGRQGVLWRGPRDSRLITSIDELRPGDTLVLPVDAGGWNELGHIPAQAPIDVAEQAFRQARGRMALRLHPDLKSLLPNSSAVADLMSRVADSEQPLTNTELRGLLQQVGNDLDTDTQFAATCRSLAQPQFGLLRENYSDGRGVVLTTRRRIGSGADWYLPVTDDGQDDRSRTLRELPISLIDHTNHVVEAAQRMLDRLPFDDMQDTFELAAKLHDLGKADERFQALLRRSDRTDAWLRYGLDTVLLAKSGGMAQSPKEREAARERAELPRRFRHEMLSVQIAEYCALVVDAEHPELVLHLIASHHGYARPFAPVVDDIEPPDVYVNGSTLPGASRLDRPPHRIDSGIAERFWKLSRRYGWWGLAYLECVLRLADQQASADEDAGQSATTSQPETLGAAK